ncbi:MAG: hypothetical protein ACT4O6_09700 [Reyranella sp.]
MNRHFLVAAGLAVLAAAALPGAASAQTAPAKWPSTCVCKSTDPNVFANYAFTVKTDGDLAAIKARLAEIDYTPVGKTIALSSICPIPKVCTDLDRVAVDDADLKLEILGYGADQGLIVDNKIQAANFGRGTWLVLSGRKK